MASINLMYTLTTIISTYLLYIGWRTYSNWQRARSCGFKVYFLPFDISNLLFTVIAVPMHPLAEKVLPESWYRPLSLAIYGNEWKDRVARRERPQPGHMVVSLSGNIDLFINDAELASAVLQRRKDFEQDPVTTRFMNHFGPSIAGSNGEQWQRQRRIIAPMLNERIMETVWRESTEQVHDMMLHLMASDEGVTNASIGGLRTVAINVLQTIGYGMPSKWGVRDTSIPPGHKLNYMDALHYLIEGFILLLVFPSWVLLLPFMPQFLRNIGQGQLEFYSFSKELLQKERRLGAKGGPTRDNLLALLANVDDAEGSSEKKGAATSKPALTVEEITGNLYQFTLAGFDTTANTMAYALTQLAIQPDLQAWIMEEIDGILSQLQDAFTYQDVFPKLERCLALMFETLRNYTPVAHIVRESAGDEIIRSGGIDYRIPAHTRCTIDLDGVSAQQRYWGDDSFEFRPSRWILSADKKNRQSNPGGAAVNAPELFSPDKGTFLPWSGGPRVCPGMKMAQVEFVSVFFNIFRKYKVEPVLREGEPVADARLRIRKTVEDSMPRITLQMNRPEDVVLKWSLR